MVERTRTRSLKVEYIDQNDVSTKIEKFFGQSTHWKTLQRLPHL